MPLNNVTLKSSLKAILLERVTANGISQSDYVKINASGEEVDDVAAYNATMADANTRAQALANELADALTAWVVQATITIPPNVIATAGSPSAQIGPPAPMPLTGIIS